MTNENDDDNVIFVGGKAPMNYVVAVLTEFKKSEEVVIKARGRAISKAVETAELVRKKFLTNVDIDEIKIGSENIIDDKTDKPMDIPTIEIYMKSI
jgi:DNA-binding protein